MRKHRRLLYVCIFVLAWLPAILEAMEASCKESAIGNPTLTGKEAWDLALDRARKWSPDVTLFGFVTLDPGLDHQGKSAGWYLQFYSETKQSVNLITIQDGKISCYANQGTGGRQIPFDDEIIFDTKRLLDIAEAAGGSKYSSMKNSHITLGMECGVTRGVEGKAMWRFNYEPPQGDTFTVILDAKTGKVDYAR